MGGGGERERESKDNAVCLPIVVFECRIAFTEEDKKDGRD
jgi:hypothetical protein